MLSNRKEMLKWKVLYIHTFPFAGSAKIQNINPENLWGSLNFTCIHPCAFMKNTYHKKVILSKLTISVPVACI